MRDYLLCTFANSVKSFERINKTTRVSSQTSGCRMKLELIRKLKNDRQRAFTGAHLPDENSTLYFPVRKRNAKGIACGTDYNEKPKNKKKNIFPVRETPVGASVSLLSSAVCRATVKKHRKLRAGFPGLCGRRWKIAKIARIPDGRRGFAQ